MFSLIAPEMVTWGFAPDSNGPGTPPGDPVGPGSTKRVCVMKAGDGRNMDFRDSQEASANMATDAIEAVAGEAAAPVADTSSKHGGAERKLNTRGDSKAVKLHSRPIYPGVDGAEQLRGAT